MTFCNYLRNCYPSLRQGVISQLLILCNRTAVHNLLLQHGFQTEWCGALRVSTTSSGAGATSRIAVIVQTGCGFLSGGRRGATLDDKEDCYGRATVALTRAIEHTYIISPLDMAGLIGMAQTLGYITMDTLHSTNGTYSTMVLLPTLVIKQRCWNGDLIPISPRRTNLRLP